MCKGALTHDAFEAYVPLIQEEVLEYLQLVPPPLALSDL